MNASTLNLATLPLEQAVKAAREAGRLALRDPETFEPFWYDILRIGVAKLIPSSAGLPDDEFDAVVSAVSKAFGEGFNEALDTPAEGHAS